MHIPQALSLDQNNVTLCLTDSVFFFNAPFFRQRLFSRVERREMMTEENMLMTLFLSFAHFFIICHVHAVRTSCMLTDRSNGNLHK